MPERVLVAQGWGWRRSLGGRAARTVHWESLRGCGARDVACGLVLARDLPAARVQRLSVKFSVV